MLILDKHPITIIIVLLVVNHCLVGNIDIIDLDLANWWNTINGERFAGLNICGLSLMKFFAEIFLRCLGQWCLLFNYS